MSLDIERSMLSRLTDPKAVAKVWDMGLRAECFFDPDHRSMFEWIQHYWQETNMASAPTFEALEREYPTVDLPRQVDEAVEYLVDSLKHNYGWMQLRDMTFKALNEGEGDPFGAIAALVAKGSSINLSITPRSARVDMSDSVEERRQRYDGRHDRINGVTLGFPEIDLHTGGQRPGELTAVTAFTKTGKSFLLPVIAIAARRAGYTPLLMTLEQDVNEMQDRIDALCSGVSYGRIEKGKLTSDEKALLHIAQDELKAFGRLLVERPARGTRTVRTMTNRARQVGADLLIIDQLSWMDGDKDYRGDRILTQKHGDIIAELKEDISSDSSGRLPCTIAVQSNRDTVKDKTNGGRGDLQNFANSSMIEQTVDLALSLWRTQEMRNNHMMGLDIIGARRCDKKSWMMQWHLEARSLIAVDHEYHG